MKINELIDALKQCRNPEAEVYLWVDGDRRAIDQIDDFSEDSSYVDINAINEETK